MNSLPTLQSTDYYEIDAYNTQIFEESLARVFPDLYTLHQYLKDTRVNVEILKKVIRGVYNIGLGTRVGRVIIHVNGQSTGVQIREDDDERNATFEDS